MAHNGEGCRDAQQQRAKCRPDGEQTTERQRSLEIGVLQYLACTNSG